MTKYKDPNSWQYGGIKKRDFNQSHDGPEELPHKKKARKGKATRCKHKYKFVKEISWASWGRKANAIYRHYECASCNKKKVEGPFYL